MSDFHGVHSSPLEIGNRVTSSRPDGLLVLGSSLLTGLLSRPSSVSFASPLDKRLNKDDRRLR